MENFRCTEFLTESPSTSSALINFGDSGVAITTTTIAKATKTISAPPSTTTASAAAIAAEATTTTTTAITTKTEENIISASTSAPTSRQQQQRRRGTKSDIGLQQSSSNDVMKLLLGQDDRCLESMFKAQSMKPMHGNCFLSVQMEVTAHHRQQVVEWIYDVCKEEYCEPDVFLLAVSLVDRFLSVQSFHRNNLQALAGACLFVSSKVKAPQPLNAERIAYYTDGAVRMDQILQGELLVLNKLNWDVSTSTALDFLDQVAARYSNLHPLSEDSRIAAHRIQLG
uniref:Cyclin N-terminal domain-containing protein n=1 Tax=Setaria digitata TaxID=48799 RepID=A0A915PHK1_9BILA